MKLRFRISLIVILIVAVIISTISFILLNTASGMQLEASIESARRLAAEQARLIKGRYDVYINSLQTVADIMHDFEEIDPTERRSQFDETMKSVLNGNERYLGMWSVWKPNAIDGMDEQYAQTVGATATGSYASWFNRDTGTVEHLTFANYQQILSNLSNEQKVSDPAPRTVKGKQVYGAQISAPITSLNGEVVGVVGCGVNLSYLQPVIDEMKRQNEDIVIATVYSTNGTILASFQTDLVGKTLGSRTLFSDPGRIAAAVRAGQELIFNENAPDVGGNVSIVLKPFYIGNTKTPWSIMIGISEKVILADINRLRNFTIGLGVCFALGSACIIFIITGNVVKPLIHVAATLENISQGEGDLTKTIAVSGNDEVADLAKYFNLTLNKIRALVLIIKQQSMALLNIGTDLSSHMAQTAASINQITGTIGTIKDRVINQSASVIETNSTMEQIVVNIGKLNGHVENQTGSVSKSSSAIEQMIANIQSVTNTLVKNANSIKELTDSSEIGRTGLQDVSTDIQEIARESEGLLEINAVMENIASQTNLLSMNAAIEAAHAGEAGKGFAVVADEIRKLSESSGEQSKTISTVLKKIKGSIDKITKSTDNVLNKFEVIDNGVKTVSDQSENIRNAMEEQSVRSQQILEVLGQLNGITQQVKDGSEEMLGGSREIITEVKNLTQLTNEITNGMNEIAAGAGEINIAVNEVNSLSGDNKENIDTLVKEVSLFKVE
ncbi:methyl-accepting chemotaxis protein [Spirochaetia bacterium]|nr:methyl-accepting chemotaxis protein [Spirochaetia bacterium]